MRYIFLYCFIAHEPISIIEWTSMGWGQRWPQVLLRIGAQGLWFYSGYASNVCLGTLILKWDDMNCSELIPKLSPFAGGTRPNWESCERKRILRHSVNGQDGWPNGDNWPSRPPLSIQPKWIWRALCRTSACDWFLKALHGFRMLRMFQQVPSRMLVVSELLCGLGDIWIYLDIFEVFSSS